MNNFLEEEKNRAEGVTKKTYTRRKFFTKIVKIVVGSSATLGLGGFLGKLFKHDNLIKPIRNPAFQSLSESNGELICYTTTSNGEHKIYRLNYCASLIWKACDGMHDEKQITMLLAKETSRDFQECLTAVHEGLQLLFNYGLITTRDKVKVFKRVVRREKNGQYNP